MLNKALACEGHGTKGNFVWNEQDEVVFQVNPNGNITLIDMPELYEFAPLKSMTVKL
ncbi:MAG: hypothetical protein ACHQF2_03485 [Flavobacteriales bacterium]